MHFIINTFHTCPLQFATNCLLFWKYRTLKSYFSLPKALNTFTCTITFHLWSILNMIANATQRAVVLTNHLTHQQPAKNLAASETRMIFEVWEYSS